MSIFVRKLTFSKDTTLNSILCIFHRSPLLLYLWIFLYHIKHSAGTFFKGMVLTFLLINKMVFKLWYKLFFSHKPLCVFCIFVFKLKFSFQIYITLFSILWLFRTLNNFLKNLRFHAWNINLNICQYLTQGCYFTLYKKFMSKLENHFVI